MSQTDPPAREPRPPAATGPAPGADTTTPAPRSGGLSWAAAGRWVAAIPSALKTVSVGLGVTLAVLVAFAEFRGQRVVIEPFEVSAPLRDNGYTSRAIASKLYRSDHRDPDDRPDEQAAAAVRLSADGRGGGGSIGH